MLHYVYIISNPDGIYYKGYSTNLSQRIQDHNQGNTKYTRGKGPWKYVFQKSFSTATEALAFEKMLKRQNHKYLDWLINSDKNEM